MISEWKFPPGPRTQAEADDAAREKADRQKTPQTQAGLSGARTKATATLISEKWIGPLDGKNGKEARGLAADIEQAITHYVRAELSAAHLKIEELTKINAGLVHDFNTLLVDGARLENQLTTAHLGMAAVREQAAEAAWGHAKKMGAKPETCMGLAHAVRTTPLPPSDYLAKVRELMEAADKARAECMAQSLQYRKTGNVSFVALEEKAQAITAALSALEPLIGKPQLNKGE